MASKDTNYNHGFLIRVKVVWGQVIYEAQFLVVSRISMSVLFSVRKS